MCVWRKSTETEGRANDVALGDTWHVLETTMMSVFLKQTEQPGDELEVKKKNVL